MPTPTPVSSQISFPNDWIAILSVVIALISLFISVLNYYEKFSKKYNGFVYPSSKIILSRIGENPCIIADCLFVNNGAKSGYVEDLLLQVKDKSASGATHQFSPLLVVEEKYFDALAEESDKNQTVRNFSSVWLDGKESIKQTIIFTPYNCSFDISSQTTIEEEIIFRSFYPEEINSAEWGTTNVTCEYKISDSNIADWKNKKAVVVESNQLIEKRTKLFEEK